MSEVTPQKRVLPGREQADSSTKKPASVPATPTTEPRVKRKYTRRVGVNKVSTPATDSRGSSTPIRDVAPTKIYGAGSLPTSTSKQTEPLSNQEYQSIAESAVLAASLHRSRMQWLCEGVFKRFWTKPVKRKGVVEQPPGNPDLKSMSKLGNATIVIEPHVFDATFYIVKDHSIVTAPFPRHVNQHSMNKVTPTPPVSSTLVASQNDKSHQAPRSADTSSTIPLASPSTSASISAPVVKQEISETTAKANTSTPATAVATPLQTPVAHLPTQSVAPAPPTRTANDPVIQMLAARAANDNRLKELMKIVAQSKASQEQLKEFQSHIDEFNRIVKEQEAKKPKIESALKPVAPGAAHPTTYGGASRPHPGPPTSIGGPMHMAPPSYMAYPQPRSEPYIKHIVIEFHSPASALQSASSDRWLFPEHAVLDIRSGGMEMIASFFVVRTGEEIFKKLGVDGESNDPLRQNYKTEASYYQPITILIKAAQHKTIETIARAAKPLQECQNRMKEIMEKHIRAPQEYLVHRLPREKVLAEVVGLDFIDSAVEMSDEEDDELRDVYGM